LAGRLFAGPRLLRGTVVNTKDPTTAELPNGWLGVFVTIRYSRTEPNRVNSETKAL